jgi:hypothetical protein
VATGDSALAGRIILTIRSFSASHGFANAGAVGAGRNCVAFARHRIWAPDDEEEYQRIMTRSTTVEGVSQAAAGRAPHAGRETAALPR